MQCIQEFKKDLCHEPSLVISSCLYVVCEVTALYNSKECELLTLLVQKYSSISIAERVTHAKNLLNILNFVMVIKHSRLLSLINF